jgi:hypothetical protein
MDLNKVEEQLKKVPEEVKKLFFSMETAQQIQAVGEDNGLLLDQIDTLIEETGLTMIGLKPANRFVDTIISSLGIKDDVAKKIAGEINEKILSVIKTKSRVITEKNNLTKEVGTPEQPTTPNISSLERIGGFSVEKEAPESGGEVTAADRSDILAGLENPPASVPSHTGTPPANLPTDTRSTAMPAAAPASTPAENHTEPLVDYLLSNPAGRSTQKVSVSSPTAPAAGKPVSPTTPPAPKNDPYKEPL